MKKKVFVNVVLLMILSSFTSLVTFHPVSAEMSLFHASGTLDEYIDYEDAIIVQGSWSVRVNANYDVTFVAQYLEENINEEIPGTFDKFKLYFEEVSPAEIVDSTCTFSGVLVWDKIGWDSESYSGYPPGPRYFSDQLHIFVQITITPSDMVIAFGGGDPPIMGGTTHAFVMQ